MPDDTTPTSDPQTNVTLDTPVAAAVVQAIANGIQAAGSSAGTVTVQLDSATANKLKAAITQGLVGAGAFAHGEDTT